MRFLFIIFFFIISCSAPAKKAFMCGERECIDKKEADEYFEKNLTYVVSVKKDKKDQSIDLVQLNKYGDKEYKKINKSLTKTKSIKEKNKITKLKEKEIKQNAKIIRKQKIKLEKRRKKEEKKIAKLKIKKEKNTLKKKKFNLLKKDNKNTNIKATNIKTIHNRKICKILTDCDIDEVSKKIINISKQNDYPDITLK